MSLISKLKQRFSGLVEEQDVESLSQLCKVLQRKDAIFDLLSLHIRISDLVFQALLFLENYDCETVGTFSICITHPVLRI